MTPMSHITLLLMPMLSFARREIIRRPPHAIFTPMPDIFARPT